MEPQQPVRLHEFFSSVPTAIDPHRRLADYAYKGLSEATVTSLKSRGLGVYQGKVRDCISQGGQLFLVHSDRLSAFDRFITHVPFKGALLASLSRYWYEKLASVLPTAYLSMPHERVLAMRQLQTVKVEMVVRGYLAGSMLRAYQREERQFCGQTLPEGLQPFQRLPQIMLTPTSKAEAFAHDENRSPEELFAEGVCTEKEWLKLADMALQLFSLGSAEFARKGWLLVDTKYEFGRDSQGNLLLLDEVHTPDSSRLWKAENFTARVQAGNEPLMFDKEVVRRYLLSQGFSGEGPVPPIPYHVVLELLGAYVHIAEELWERPFQAAYASDELILQSFAQA